MINKKKNSEIPLYLFMGFLDSGKTTFIQDTLKEDYFNDGERTLIIACEDGEEEYQQKLLSSANCTLVYVEDEEDFTTDYLNSALLKYYPDRVLLELNGMWNLENVYLQMEDTPLMVFQTIVTANGETFDMYMNNMRSMAVEMFKMAEMVIINRCTPEMGRASWKRSIKAVNPRTSVLFEMADGYEDADDDDMLPYDIEVDHIDLEDTDFGIWFIDAMERPEIYDGKSVTMKAMVYKSIRLPKGCFVPGRHAMTCCADDIQFIGYLCHLNHAHSSSIKTLKNKSWVSVTADIKYEYSDEYHDKGPVLYATRIEAADPPKEQLVFF